MVIRTDGDSEQTETHWADWAMADMEMAEIKTNMMTSMKMQMWKPLNNGKQTSYNRINVIVLRPVRVTIVNEAGLACDAHRIGGLVRW